MKDDGLPRSASDVTPGRAAAADPEEAEAGQQEGKGEVDRGLQRPIAARGLVAELLPEAQGGEVVVTGGMR